MILKSCFENCERIPVKYTADGENVNPPLEISQIPINAKSLVLIMDDPDAPYGIWNHWILFNIHVQGDFLIIKEKSAPTEAVQGKNSWKKDNYMGPSPPSGTHRYFLKVYALDIKSLGLTSSTDKSAVEKAMLGHVLEKTELIGVYSR